MDRVFDLVGEEGNTRSLFIVFFITKMPKSTIDPLYHVFWVFFFVQFHFLFDIFTFFTFQVYLSSLHDALYFSLCALLDCNPLLTVLWIHKRRVAETEISFLTLLRNRFHLLHMSNHVLRQCMAVEAKIKEDLNKLITPCNNITSNCVGSTERSTNSKEYLGLEIDACDPKIELRLLLSDHHPIFQHGGEV